VVRRLAVETIIIDVGLFVFVSFEWVCGFEFKKALATNKQTNLFFIVGWRKHVFIVCVWIKLWRR
jgi:hypothetical protein